MRQGSGSLLSQNSGQLSYICHQMQQSGTVPLLPSIVKESGSGILTSGFSSSIIILYIKTLTSNISSSFRKDIRLFYMFFIMNMKILELSEAERLLIHMIRSLNFLMAGASANRTQQWQDRYHTDGFEDRENHQALSAPTSIAIFRMYFYYIQNYQKSKCWGKL
jgi:hypothetical protein